MLFHETREKLEAQVGARLGHSADVDDVVSMVYTTAWLKRESFSGDFRAFMVWVMNLGVQQSLAWRRSLSRKAHREDGEPVAEEAVAPTVETEDWVNADRIAFIKEHVNRLGPALRRVVMWQLEGLTYTEMARRMDVDERRVRTLWARAVERIRLSVEADKRVPKGIAPAPAPAWWWFDQFMEVVGDAV